MTMLTTHVIVIAISHKTKALTLGPIPKPMRINRHQTGSSLQQGPVLGPQ